VQDGVVTRNIVGDEIVDESGVQRAQFGRHG
jgi:hypothetical protein